MLHTLALAVQPYLGSQRIANPNKASDHLLDAQVPCTSGRSARRLRKIQISRHRCASPPRLAVTVLTVRERSGGERQVRIRLASALDRVLQLTMPSPVHHGGNSFAAALFATLLLRLDRASALHSLTVHDEYTLEKGIRADTEYLINVALRLRSVLRQEFCYAETLPHATRKVRTSRISVVLR